MDRAYYRRMAAAGILVILLIPHPAFSEPATERPRAGMGGMMDNPKPEQGNMDGMAMGEGKRMEMAHGFPHPFFNHMGIPDMVGMVSTRITGYRQGADEEESSGDYGFHLEAGIYERLGLHIRNNEVKQSPRTDVMLMYSVLQDAEGESGLSIFGGALIPSGTIPRGQDDAIGAFGLSGRLMLSDSAIFDGNIHYMPEMEMTEIGLSGIYKASASLFPIVELEGKLTDETTIVYLLPALKFKLKPELFLGVGSQFPLTSDKEFDARALVQIDVAW